MNVSARSSRRHIRVLDHAIINRGVSPRGNSFAEMMDWKTVEDSAPFARLQAKQAARMFSRVVVPPLMRGLT
jgi:hypothetical protein